MDEVVFGRYRLGEGIGAGAMGTVYRAHDSVIGRQVAIKVLAAELVAEPGYRERFRREAHAVARLSEPHIIPVYDTGEIDGRLYLVMPVVEGTDLQSMIRQDGPLSPERAVGVIEQVGAALDAAHRAGLVHRDVKPSNVLVTARDFVYLIDFGIAHDTEASRLTRTGSIVGTFAYMAPERMQTGAADGRGDVYGLACVLCECVTGQLPYPGDTLEQQIAGHLTADPPKPSLLSPAVPARFDDVIARGMAKDPDHRYQTAEQLATAARAALTTSPALAPAQATVHMDRPMLSYPPPGPYTPPGPYIPYHSMPLPLPGGPRRSRTRWIIGGCVAALALVITAVVVAVVGLGRGPAATTRTSPRSSPPTAPSAAPTLAPNATLAPDRLDAILLHPVDINTVMGVSSMQPQAPIGHATGSNQATVSNPDCLGAFYPGQNVVYEGSGYTAISVQQLSEPGDVHYHLAAQAAASFPSADQALAFLKTSAGKWGACAGQTITQTAQGQDSRWTFGNLIGDVPALAQLRTLEGGNGQACQHVLRALVNVVIEVAACGPRINNQANQLADKMAVNVARQAR